MVDRRSEKSNLSDCDLQRQIVTSLAASQMPGLRELQVVVNAGTVTLRGRVRSFYEKQLGQQFSRRVAGVLQFVDEIDVVEEASSLAN